MELLKKTILAAGGEIWKRPTTLHLVGKAKFTPFGKLEKAMTFDHYEMHRVFPNKNEEAHRANGKVSFEAKEETEIFFQLKFDGQKSNVFLSEKAKPYAEHFKWSNNFGFGIIRFWEDSGFVIENLVDDQIEGHASHFIKITDPKSNETFFGIDQKTNWIRMVGFDTKLGWHHRIYSNFEKAKNNFLQPKRVRIYFDGIKWMDITWERFSVNEKILDSIFE